MTDWDTKAILRLWLVVMVAGLMLTAGQVFAQNREDIVDEESPWASVEGATDKESDPFADSGSDDPFGGNSEKGDMAGESGQGSDAGSPWGEAAAASPFEVGGSLMNKFAFDSGEDNDFEDLYHNHARLRLEATFRPSQAVEMVLGGNWDHYADYREDDWDTDSDLRLWNAYLKISGRGYALKVGNQIVRWGKADGFSPLDNINPEDLRDGIAGRREDRKLPIPMVNMEVYGGNLTLQGIYIPFFVHSEYDFRDTDWAFFDHYEEQVGLFGLTEEDLSNDLSEGEAGLRLSGIAGSVDYAVSYFYTNEDVAFPDSLSIPVGLTPVFSDRIIRDLATFAHLTGQKIRMRYDRQNIYGLEFETTLGAFGLRGDFVYTDNVSYITEQLERVRKPVVQYVIGADYNGPGEFYLNVQLGQAYINDYDDAILLAEEVSTNVNGTISKGFFNGELKLEFRYLFDLDGNGALYNPMCVFKYWQNLKLELGAEIFDGNDSNPLGFYRDNDQFYVKAEWVF